MLKLQFDYIEIRKAIISKKVSRSLNGFFCAFDSLEFKKTTQFRCQDIIKRKIKYKSTKNDFYRNNQLQTLGKTL